MAESRATGTRATWRSLRKSRASQKNGSRSSRFPPFCLSLLFSPPHIVTAFDLRHHSVERFIEVDALPVGHADQHKQDVGHLHPEIALWFVFLLGLLPEAVIHLPGQLANLLCQPREVGQWMEVPFFELLDPGIDSALRVAKGHGKVGESEKGRRRERECVTLAPGSTHPGPALFCFPPSAFPLSPTSPAFQRSDQRFAKHRQVGRRP